MWFNGLRFEDSTSDEQIYMHAQKDHVMEILHDESHTIGNNREKKSALTRRRRNIRKLNSKLKRPKNR